MLGMIKERGMSSTRYEKYDYWYRMYNDGYSEFDSLFYRDNWLSYKAWMEELEDKAMDTLRMAIDMLLIRAREKTVEYDDDGASKSQQLESLLRKLNQAAEDGKSELKKAKKPKKAV